MADKNKAFMQEALSLARAGLGTVWPNPSVGCVIVRDGDVVGRGRTQPGGRPHAEVEALNEAGDLAEGAVMYVSLEPCCHWGESPPCTDAIIAAGLKRVFVAIADPDSRVDGRGVSKMRDAGLKVEVGLCRDEARDVNAGFFHRIETGRPLVSCIDPADMAVRDLFSEAVFFDAVFLNLSEWVRMPPLPEERILVVLDDPAVAPSEVEAKGAAARRRIWFVAPRGRNPSRLGALKAYFADMIEIDGDDRGGADLAKLLHQLGTVGLTRIAVTADGPLATDLAEQGLL